MSEARGELLATMELNRKILDAMPGGIVHVAKDGAILAANAEALRILGMSFDEITQKYTRDWEPETIWEDGSPCTLADYPVTKAMLTGEPQPPATIGVRRPDGKISWAIFTAVPVDDGVIVTFVDITDRKNAQDELRRSQDLLRSVLDSAPNPIATADLDGRLLILNKGPPIYETPAIGLPAWERIAPEDQAKVRAHFQRVVETGETVSYECKGRSGIFWLVHAGPRREGEKIVGVTFVAWDVTKQRELESRVAIADRMASIGTLAAGVAHEINNPLTYLLANLEWLSRSPDPQVAERAIAALEGAQRIRSVVSDVGTFSHVSEGRRALLDVRQVIDAALRMAHAEIRCRARVTRRYEEIPAVIANDARLGQVFLNLIVNAAQAIPEGEIDKNEISIATSTAPDGRISVEISDTGIGIEPDVLAKVFDPFVTTKPRGIGTGLGLYISRNIVTSLGGEISVRSAVGEGTTFRVVLPAAADVAAQPPRVESDPGPASDRRLRILVADDEQSIAWVMKSFLAEHDVFVAHTGREAIDLLDKSEFDLTFCDLVMPDLTGIDVYDHLRECKPGAEKKLIFMTGGAFTERTRKFLETVPNEVLDKPFTLGDVARVVSRRAR